MKKGKYMDALLSLPLNYSLFIDMEKNKPINVALDDIRYKPEIINNLEYRFINDDLGMVISFIQMGSKLSDKADEAHSQMKKAEETINNICAYLTELENTAIKYSTSINNVYEKYVENFDYISYQVNELNKVDWNDFNQYERKLVENVVLLVGLLYNMCKVSLVNKAENENEMNTVNRSDVNASIIHSKQVLNNLNMN